MQMQSNPYIAWQVIAMLLTLGILLYTLTRPRKKPESKPFAQMMLGATVWSISNILAWISPSYEWQSFFNFFTYIGVLLIPTGWFLFSVTYTGIGLDKIKKLGNIIWIFPVFVYIAILTNEFHHLFFISEEIILNNGFAVLRSEFGPIFYVHTGYSYLLIGSGMLFLIYSLISNFRNYGVYAYGLLIGVLTPVVGNVYYIFGPFPESFPDPTPFLFGVTGIGFAWTVFGGRVLEAVEIAHDSIVQNLSSGVVVLDLDDHILDINPAAIQILGGQPKEFTGRSILDVIRKNQEVEKIIQQGLEHIKSSEFTFTHHLVLEQAGYDVVFTRVQDSFGLVTGYLLEFRDISAKIQAEENLASTRQAFEATMDTLQDSYFEADPTGRITYANKAFITNLGLKDGEEVIGLHFRKFTDREMFRDIFNKFKELYETKQPLDLFKYNYRNKEGQLFVGETVVSPILRGEEVIGSRGTIRDVTERVHREREIAEQKDLLDGLLQNAPFAIVINNLENEITVTNPAFEKFFGYDTEEVVGKNLNELFSAPDTLEEMRTLTGLSEEQEVFHTGKRSTKDGTLVDVDIFSVPFYVNEQKFGNLIFYQDISDRLKAESELEKTQTTTREILDSLEDPYFEANEIGQLTYANKAFARAIGYDTREEVIGKNFRHITKRSKVREVFERFTILYKTGKPIEPFNFHYLNKKRGDELIAEIVVSPIIEDGEVVGSRGIVRDISVRIKAEEVLRQAKEAAEYRAGELAAINRVAEKVGQTLDLQEILDSVCLELASIFEVKNAGIGLMNKEGDGLEIVAFHSNIPDVDNAQGVVIPVEGNSYLTEIIETKKTVVIQNAQTDTRTQASHELYRSRDTKAMLIVPLLVRGQAIGNIGLPAMDLDHKFTENEIELAETIASQVASAIDNAQLYAQTETALGAAESDLEIGSQIQSGFFPVTIPELPGWEIATHFHSARQVAGDFYDVFKLNDSELTAFVIADVCDKGVGAALFMVLFRSLMRAFSDIPIDEHNVHDRLLEIISKTNNYIANIHGKSNMFATVFFGILDPESGLLHYVNGGHEPPLILNHNGQIVTSLMPTGPAVGLLPNLPFSVEHIQLDPGDFLLGFTDGATDARNKAGNLFTEDRLVKTVSAPWTSIFSMIFELEVELKNHIGGQDQYDDITMISFRRKMTQEMDYHAICRPAELGVLGELRDFVSAAAEHSGLDSEDIFAFKLSAEEILTNIIQYGYEGNEPGLLAIAFECDHQKSTLKIWDDGAHFPLDQVESPDLNADWEVRKMGGLGVYFVKELMDKVTYTREGNNTNLLILEKNKTK